MKKRSHLLAGLGLVLALASALGLTGTLAACGSRSGDPPADPGDPSALGTGLRLRNVMNPSSPDHPDVDAGVEVSVAVTGASVTWIDTYDETANGKSLGTVYVQDVASQKQYSGSSLYAPDYFPASLAPAPGDVLDLTGDFEELPNIGTAVFSGGATLPQFSHPVATFRYEYTPPDAGGDPGERSGRLPERPALPEHARDHQERHHHLAVHQQRRSASRRTSPPTRRTGRTSTTS